MYEPDSEKIKRYLRGSGDARHIDWHAWLHDLSETDRKQLIADVLSAESRHGLGDYARQYYLHFCTDTEDDELRGIEHDFVAAQLEERPSEEVAQFEDKYFERARELLRLQEQGNEN